MQAGYFQFEVAYGEPERNRAAVEAAVAPLRGPGVLVLPELAFSGYDFPDRRAASALSERFGDGPASALLLRLAQQTGLVLTAGYCESDGEDLFNSALTADPDGRLHNYRKLHLFDREKSIFSPGDAPPNVIETSAGPIGVMVCFDWFFPEVARSLALGGAWLVAHPSNLVLPWCQRAMFARSVENRVYTTTCNRIGTETQGGRALRFTGGSQVLSPHGETLAQAPPEQPQVTLVEVEPALAASKRLNNYNDLFADRRTDMYSRLTPGEEA